jgi:hypothetical protein
VPRRADPAVIASGSLPLRWIKTTRSTMQSGHPPRGMARFAGAGRHGRWPQRLRPRGEPVADTGAPTGGGCSAVGAGDAAASVFQRVGKQPPRLPPVAPNGAIGHAARLRDLRFRQPADATRSPPSPAVDRPSPAPRPPRGRARSRPHRPSDRRPASRERRALPCRRGGRRRAARDVDDHHTASPSRHGRGIAAGPRRALSGWPRDAERSGARRRQRRAQ